MNSTIRTICILLLLTPDILKAAPQTQNLKDIFELALQHDANWAAARYANTAAQEKIEQGKALLLPTVSINSSATRSDTSIQYTGNTVYRNNNQSEKFNTLSYGINVNQPLYRKQNTVQYQSATLQVNFADLQLQQDRQDLLLKSAQAYFDVLLAQDKLTLNQAQKSAISSQLAQAKANFKAGVSTITDVDEAQAKFDTVQSQEIASNNEIENKKQAVQLLTGQYPGQLSGIQAKISLSLPVLAKAEKNTENPSDNHPNDNIALWIQQAQQNNIDAVASYNRTNANGGINGFGSDLNNTTVGLQFQMPLYQGGATSSKVREAIANQQKAQEEIEAARRKAELDTRQAYLEVTSNIAQANANEQTLYSTESQLASTNQSFKLGIRTNVDVLNAQQQVFNAKRDLLQTHYNYLLGLLKLKYASGILHDEDLEEVNGQLGVVE
jgi:outer membrane protein